jgi:hypothetical protein
VRGDSGRALAPSSECVGLTMQNIARLTRESWINQLWLLAGGSIAALLGLWWQFTGAAVSSQVSWGSSILLFATAVYQAWREENARALTEQARNARPELTGEIVAGLFRRPYHLPADVDTGEAHVMLKVSVANSHPAPVRVRNWRLWIDLDGVVQQAKGPLYIPDQTVFYVTDPIPGLIAEQVARTEYPTPRLDELGLHQAIQPETPLTGWLWFALPGAHSEYVRDCAAFTLEIVDEFGNAHVIRRSNGLQWPDNVGVLDSGYPGDAYTLRWMDGKKPHGFI